MTWFGKKSSKNKIESREKTKEKAKSFEEVRKGKDCGGFLRFDSDGGDKNGRLHPLPLPLTSSDRSLAVVSGYNSASSSGSSGSSDDPLDFSQFGLHNRGQNDGRFNSGSRSPVLGSRGATASTSPIHPRFSGANLEPVTGNECRFSPRSRSPGPGSRVHTARFCGTNLESPSGKQDDGRSTCHPLPLPPSSPTSPSSSHSMRSIGLNESTNSTPSKWKKGKLLGRGTFGHVYLGFNSESGQMCAIKEVRLVLDDQNSRECLKQLNQEISLLSQLSHPNIVQYYGSELGEETLSVYLEYVSGGSIHKLLQEYGAFGEPVIQNYTWQILSGLAYLHGRHTVHRDIKGANILVDPNGEVKLADFGMAKHIASSSSMLSFKGSPYWMAPEVVMSTNGYSSAVDIWSLGCTILEMATSKPPWSQFEGVAAIFKIGNSKDIPEIPNHLSNEAKSFIRLCLQRDPSARPTALQLLDHPFVRDQTTTRAANISITRDAFPFTFDGSHTPTSLELNTHRKSFTSCDVDYMAMPNITVSRAVKTSRDSSRMITSLPVSPCSSPLRQYEPAYKSCFISPPHPTFAFAAQSGYNVNDFSLCPVRRNTYLTIEPREVPMFRNPTPGGSPRRLL
ncbi:Protein kinase domain [Dillenia turbinata]|uniref:mitogen-activated protein kinase kinase kinase n=1 Tax=Dillenia turbinata TaxID=194707 RepID=A0AAN8V6B1_9MAGN